MRDLHSQRRCDRNRTRKGWHPRSPSHLRRPGSPHGRGQPRSPRSRHSPRPRRRQRLTSGGERAASQALEALQRSHRVGYTRPMWPGRTTWRTICANVLSAGVAERGELMVFSLVDLTWAYPSTIMQRPKPARNRRRLQIGSSRSWGMTSSERLGRQP